MILALDTSTLTLSMALVDRASMEPVEEVALGPPRKQSEMLPGEIGALLSRHGLKPEALDYFAVGLGPGSFTGLRIGLASAKALGYAARVMVAGGSSLAAAALDGPEGVPLVPIAVARRGELYAAVYRREGEHLEPLAPEQALTPAETAQLAARYEGAVVLGPAAREYRAELEKHGARAVIDAPAFPRALCVAKVAPPPEHFDLQALFALEPHYVRASEAERNPKFPASPTWAPIARIRED